MSFTGDGGEVGGDVSVYSCANEWDLSTINYDAIKDDTIKIATLYCVGDGDLYTLDVTEYMQSVIGGEESYNGFIIGFDKPVDFYTALDENPDNIIMPSRSIELRDTIPQELRDTIPREQCDTIPVWKPGGGFIIGDKSTTRRKVYVCTNLWCNSIGYAPNTIAGSNTWEKIGDCMPKQLSIPSTDASEEFFQPKLVIQLDANNIIDKPIGNVIKEKHTISCGKLFLSKRYIGSIIHVFDSRGRVVDVKHVASATSVKLNICKGVYYCSVKKGGKKTLFAIINQ